jgi:hypothetical protein
VAKKRSAGSQLELPVLAEVKVAKSGNLGSKGTRSEVGSRKSNLGVVSASKDAPKPDSSTSSADKSIYQAISKKYFEDSD